MVLGNLVLSDNTFYPQYRAMLQPISYSLSVGQYMWHIMVTLGHWYIYTTYDIITTTDAITSVSSTTPSYLYIHRYINANATHECVSCTTVISIWYASEQLISHVGEIWYQSKSSGRSLTLKGKLMTFGRSFLDTTDLSVQEYPISENTNLQQNILFFPNQTKIIVSFCKICILIWFK